MGVTSPSSVILPPDASAPERVSGRSWRKFRKNTLAVVGLLLVALLVAAALLGPVLAPHHPDATHFTQAFRPPGPAHLFGTDDLGRDVLSRVLYGAAGSLGSGLLVVVLAVLVGVPLGLVAGYQGGVLDEVLMRIMDAGFAFPGLVLAMAIAWLLGPSLMHAVVAITIVSIPQFARITRGQVLAVRTREFVDAARAIGASPLRIMFRHILLNTMTPVVVVATLSIGGSILSIASLSFLGLGPPPPAPNWGAMVLEGSQYLTQAPWLVLFPGLAIFLAVMGFSMLGDGLRDVFDPRT